MNLYTLVIVFVALLVRTVINLMKKDFLVQVIHAMVVPNVTTIWMIITVNALQVEWVKIAIHLLLIR
jgi:hypothetical protein